MQLMNIKISGLMLGMLMATTQLFAQDNGQGQTKTDDFKPMLEHRILAGFNFGATAPVGLPNTIRKINGYWPEFSPSLGYELSYRATRKWGAAVAVKLDYKGMGTKDEVQYFPTIITTDDGGRFEGDFTGKNQTTVRNAYVSFPISAVFTPNDRWRFNLGGYVAWLFSSNFYGTVSDGYIRNGGSLGEKIIITEATFDFGTEVRSFDCGLQGGAAYRVGKRLSIDGNLNWGLRPIFPGDFKGMSFPMYNIYLTLGVAYKI
ncbi:Outer membrane protein beta-barrel domain-containing protein [Chitinophaga arvensicola]|uniref:Outer membrane protein beta-barrel domain-containing protein n=2 Tax=Chitinophaga arvensicola TaxID=29529 RepID=A0A1I0S5Y1_9BACT|nr:Outer membrane protein beta-barrel domain-containing protein [Chitinophaga arvensicola]